LQGHIKQVHQKLKPFQCQVCDLCFAQAQTLRTHVSAIHLRLKPFECHLCKKQFTTKREVKGHTDVAHKMKQNQFLCDQCCSSFAKNSLLIKHLNVVHKGLKAFSCSECGSQFSYKQGLLKHFEKNHFV
jgi:KRAB domain-containing zinc finger protein